jgi:hypothetical protein
MSKNNFNYSSIIFVCSEHYGGDEDAMWKDIKTLQRLLIRTNYNFKVYADDGDPNFIVVEFAEADVEISDGELRWTTWKELELLEPEE